MLSVFFVTQIPSVQTWAGGVVQRSLAQGLGIPVSIGSIRYFPFTSLSISTVTLMDPDSVPMISLARVKTDISVSSLLSNQIEITLLQADSVSLDIRRRADGTLNLSCLSGGAEADTCDIDAEIDAEIEAELNNLPSGPILCIDRMSFNGCSIHYSPLGEKSLSVQNLELELDTLRIGPRLISVDVRHIGADIPSLLPERAEMQASLSLKGGNENGRSLDTLAVSHCWLTSGDTRLKLEKAMVVMDSTTVMTADVEMPVAQISSDLLTKLTGRPMPPMGLGLKGSIDSYDIDIDWFRATMGERTFASGSAIMSRPDHNPGQFPPTMITISEGRTDLEDIAAVTGAEIGADMVNTVGLIELQGTAELLQSNAQAEMEFKTQLGTINMGGTGRTSNKWTDVVFTANMSMDADLSKPTSGTLGNTRLNLDANGRLEDGRLRFAIVDGMAPNLRLCGLDYEMAELGAIVEQHTANAMVQITDEANGMLKMICETDWGNKQRPYTSVTLHANDLNISKMGIVPMPDIEVDSTQETSPTLPHNEPTIRLSAKVRAEVEGRDIATADGALQIADLSIETPKERASMESLQAELTTDSLGNREIVFEGDKVNGRISGTYDIAGLSSELTNQARLAMPSLFAQSVAKEGNKGYNKSNKSKTQQNTTEQRQQMANVDITLTDIEPLVRIWAPSLAMADSMHLRGNVNSESHTAWFSASTPHLSFGSVEARTLEAGLLSDNGSISVGVASDVLNLPVLGRAYGLAVTADATDDVLAADALWSNVKPNAKDKNGIGGGEPKGILNTEFSFGRDEEGQLNIGIAVDQSQLTMGKDIWMLDSTHITLSPKLIDVSNLYLYHNDRMIRAAGRASEQAEDTLRLEIQKIDIESLMADMKSTRFSLAGDLYSRASFSSLLSKPSAKVEAWIENLYVDGDRLEHMDIGADWQPEADQLDLGITIVTGGKPRAVANGYVNMLRKDMRIDFDIDSLSAGFLNFYLDACIDSWRGTTSGNLSLSGPLDDIKLNAGLKMNNDNYFRVMETNTTYHIDHDDSLFLTPTRMIFNNIRFSDDYEGNGVGQQGRGQKGTRGHMGIFGGDIKHDMFSNLQIGLKFDVFNLLLLNTTARESQAYYGKVFGTGHMDVLGITDDILIDIKAQTEANSTFCVVPTAKTELSQQDYISFVSHHKAEDNEETNGDGGSESTRIAGMGTRANLDLTITPDAELSVIINPQTDNRLSGRGNGQLQITVDRNGDLNMFGDYVINQGLYNFSFENVISKQFVINDGGHITWDGGPYDANVDITATYKLKASLYDLVKGGADETNNDLKRRVPINCNILLSNKLTNPDVNFDIEIPSSQNFNQYAFDQYVSTPEEMSRQVFSLLVTGRFYATQDATSQNADGTDYLGTTASELLSNQLSNMFSKNKYNLGVGVNYRPGDEVTNEEYEVAIQTQVMDNKIMLSGNIGYGRDASGSGSDDGSLIGDFDVEVKLNKRGNIRAKAYTHSNNDVIYETSPTTQGIGISFQEEFNSFRELVRWYWNRIFHRRKNREAMKGEETAPTQEGE